jgi:hypothetical protein
MTIGNPSFSLLASRFSLLASRFSLLASRFSLLASRFSPLIMLLAFGSSLVACSPEPSNDAPVSATTEPITNGADDQETAPRNATVALWHPGDSNSYCSGSLVTSTFVLTARHCNAQVGDIIQFGLVRAAPLARRTIDAVEHAGPPVGDNATASQMARDVTLVRFSPPITMQASPLRPSFERPQLTEDSYGFPRGTISGGMSGYGLLTFATPGGGLDTLSPNLRQVFTSSAFPVRRLETGGGYAVWVYTFERDIGSGDPRTGSGDSGGPLFRELEHGARDVLGVLHGRTWKNCAFYEVLCNDDNASNVWADITAPSMRAWLEGLIDPNGDGRWMGEVDYVRTAFGTPGCDPKNNPGCDNGCNATLDRDCDLVLNQNDNCPDDYNPDQRNSDDAVHPLDPATHDPGDICDLCPTDYQDNGDNCNADAEILRSGVRPKLLEDAVIGNPLNPAPLPIVEQVSVSYAGDRCDWAPCTELGSATVPLDPGKYGGPDPLSTQCLKWVPSGGACLWQARAKIEHDGRWLPYAPMNGATGYRFCRCDGPFKEQMDRINNCILSVTGPQCPWQSLLFATEPQLKEIHVDPPFSPIAGSSPLEHGTADVFTGTKKTIRPFFTWLFEQDVLTITGMPNPTLPLDEAAAASIAIDGLLQSNVRQTENQIPAHLANLESYWLPMSLRVEPGSFGGSQWTSAPVGGGFMDDCPPCGFGLITPWLLVSQPAVAPVVLGVTMAGAITIDTAFDAGVLDLLQSAAGSADRVLIGAAEHRSTLSRLAEPYAPRLVVVDGRALTVYGVIGQDPDGRFVSVRGATTGPSGPAVMTAGSNGALKGTPPGPSGTGAAAALSALERSLFVLRGTIDGSGRDAARLHVLDLLSGGWKDAVLSGPVLPEVPLALTYSAQAKALFAVDRSNAIGGGTVRLFRIRLDGRTELLAQGYGIAQDAEVYLTASELGRVVLSATRQHPAHFGVLEIEAFGPKPKPTRLYKATGRLAAAPFLTQRALHLLLRKSNGELEALELEPVKMPPAHGKPLQQVFR